MRIFLLVAALMLAPGFCFAGVVYEIETKSHDGSGATSITAMVDGGKLKMTAVETGNTNPSEDMIFHGNVSRLVIVDHETRKYIVMDKNFATNMADQLSRSRQQALELMAQAMQNMSPEQQKAIAEMMSQRTGYPAPEQNKPKTVRVVNTGQKATRQGYPTILYRVFEGQQMVEEVWATPANKLEGGREMLAAFTRLAGFHQEMGKQFGAERSSWFAAITELDGRFPIAGSSYVNGELEDEFILKSTASRALAASEFEPPAGYTKDTFGP